jgi:uncharacterized integral membrane protein (TIGR00698 family)
MAQVVAAGFGVSEESARVATVVKLVRIALLAPVVFYLAWRLRHQHREAGTAHVSAVPWFLVMFVIFTLINSTGWLPKSVVETIKTGDLWLLCLGMAGVGLQTGFHDIRNAGPRPILAGALQWLVLATVAYALAILLCR